MRQIQGVRGILSLVVIMGTSASESIYFLTGEPSV
jgi:hypothetical protein